MLHLLLLYRLRAACLGIVGVGFMEIITSFIFAFIATMAFAVLFQSPKKILLTDGLIGAVGWVVFISLRDQMGYSSFYANFFGTLALALLSELSARIFKQPATVLSFPVLFRWFLG